MKWTIVCVALALVQQSLGQDDKILSKLNSIDKTGKGLKRLVKIQQASIDSLGKAIDELKSKKCEEEEKADNSGLPASCMEILEQGNTESGVYTVGIPNGILAPMRELNVYCDMETDGGGWMVFQRRTDGSQDFMLGWDQYSVGFGNLESEFWLGNSDLNMLTTSAKNELRVDLRSEGESKFAKYSTFQVASADQQFRLTVDGYSGDAGDSLKYQSGKKFSTIDQDNDDRRGSCADDFKGAWWYADCHESNLNGMYLDGEHESYADGVEWKAWKGYKYSLQFTEMKIRPIA